MVVTYRIELAKQLSKYFHMGQKYGTYDYYEHHILGVVKTLELVAKEVTEDMVIVALLHDVLEDSPCTYDTLENIFGQVISDYVNCLTYVKGYDKEMYIKNTRSYEVTRIVKYADSLFNHQECIKEGNLKRAEKYQRNLQQLYHKDLFIC